MRPAMRKREWMPQLVWFIGVSVLFAYATTTTNGGRDLPHGLGAVALVVAAVWTLVTFRGMF